MNLQNSMLLACALVFGQSAVAGQFSVQCYGQVKDCAEPVSDIVSDKFTTRFPADRWQLSVLAEFQRYSDGGGVGYAVAGVIPRGTGQVPIRRFSATIRIDNTRRVDAFEEGKLTLEVYRDAVSLLMAQCERSEKCEVYLPRSAR